MVVVVGNVEPVVVVDVVVVVVVVVVVDVVDVDVVVVVDVVDVAVDVDVVDVVVVVVVVVVGPGRVVVDAVVVVVVGRVVVEVVVVGSGRARFPITLKASPPRITEESLSTATTITWPVTGGTTTFWPAKVRSRPTFWPGFNPVPRSRLTSSQSWPSTAGQ